MISRSTTFWTKSNLSRQTTQTPSKIFQLLGRNPKNKNISTGPVSSWRNWRKKITLGTSWSRCIISAKLPTKSSAVLSQIVKVKNKITRHPPDLKIPKNLEPLTTSRIILTIIKCWTCHIWRGRPTNKTSIIHCSCLKVTMTQFCNQTIPVVTS